MLARIFPNTTISTMLTSVKTSVFRSDRQNTPSAKISSKLRTPTKSKDGSPVVTSENANAIASRNGTPTSAMM